jgi:hypothetical protein
MVLFEREKSLLPSTQVHIPAVLRERGLRRMLEKCEAELNTLQTQRAPLTELSEPMYLRYLILSKLSERDQKDEVKQEKHYSMRCPIGDCRGFLSSRYKCGICGGKVCSACHVELQDEKHDCDPDAIKTVEELKKTTRNCPNCQVPIYKSSGCDQMWCVACHTAFNWKTGAIEKGIIHNPEYFEFIRKSGLQTRNPHEQICGGIPAFQAVIRKAYTRQESDFLTNFYQNVAHVRHTILARLPTAMDNVSNQDLRIAYLMKELSEADFKSQLHLREKTLEKKIETRQILDTYVTVSEELLRQLVGGMTVKDLARHVSELIDMVNENISELSKTFAAKVSPIALPPKGKEAMLNIITYSK